MRRDVAIKVDRLSKTYPVYASPMDALKEVVTGRPRHTDFHALHDVSFRVRRGERVGIVGANGAGKSTLLKILAGTVDHNAGRFRIQGRLRAILELGTGFHEECSGRENIEMGGLCLGYNRKELEARTDWIIDFAELRHVIDRPLRTYSSGMKMRLMYAVAFCMPVEIMIIDEALATGDASFVRKCTNHIVELCGGGTTALVVSHNLYFLERICHRVIYLRDGRVVADGDPLSVCKLYEQDLGRDFVQGESAPVDAPPVHEGVADAGPARDDDAHAAASAAHDGASGGAQGDATGSAAGAALNASSTRAYRRDIDGGLCGDHAAPIRVGLELGDAFIDDKPLAPRALDPETGARPPSGARENGAGEIVHADGRVEPIDFAGAPAVRARKLLRLREAKLYDADGRATQELGVGRPCRVRFVLESSLRLRDVHLGFMIWNDRNEHVATTTNVCSLDAHGRPNGLAMDLREGLLSVDVVFPALRLGAGRYWLKFGVAPGPEHYSDDDLLLSEARCLAFQVIRSDHVQTVHYEPHSVWTPPRYLGVAPALADDTQPAADTPAAADSAPESPVDDADATMAPHESNSSS